MAGCLVKDRRGRVLGWMETSLGVVIGGGFLGLRPQAEVYC